MPLQLVRLPLSLSENFCEVLVVLLKSRWLLLVMSSTAGVSSGDRKCQGCLFVVSKYSCNATSLGKAFLAISV